MNRIKNIESIDKSWFQTVDKGSNTGNIRKKIYNWLWGINSNQQQINCYAACSQNVHSKIRGKVGSSVEQVAQGN